MDCLISSIWTAVGIISNLGALIFFAVFTQKQPDIPLRVCDTVDVASSVLTKLKTMGKNAWITELDFHLLSHYTNTIDTELREIFDYARFENFWFTIVLTRFTLISAPRPAASAHHWHQRSAELSECWYVLPSLQVPAHLLLSYWVLWKDFLSTTEIGEFRFWDYRHLLYKCD